MPSSHVGEARSHSILTSAGFGVFLVHKQAGSHTSATLRTFTYTVVGDLVDGPALSCLDRGVSSRRGLVEANIPGAGFGAGGGSMKDVLQGGSEPSGSKKNHGAETKETRATIRK